MKRLMDHLSSLPTELRYRIYHFLGFPVDRKYKYYERLFSMLSPWKLQGDVAGPCNRPVFALQYSKGELYGLRVINNTLLERAVFERIQRTPLLGEDLRGKVYYRKVLEARRSLLKLCCAQLMRVNSIFAMELYPLLYNDQVQYKAHAADILHPQFQNTIFSRYITTLSWQEAFTYSQGNWLPTLKAIVRHCVALQDLECPNHYLHIRPLGRASGTILTASEHNPGTYATILERLCHILNESRTLKRVAFLYGREFYPGSRRDFPNFVITASEEHDLRQFSVALWLDDWLPRKSCLSCELLGGDETTGELSYSGCGVDHRRDDAAERLKSTWGLSEE